MATPPSGVLPCPTCRTTDFERVLEGIDRLHGKPGRFTVVRCRGCRLLLTRPVPENLMSYYEADYIPYRIGGGKGRLARIKAAAMQRFVAGAVGRAEGLKILDVGCGDGQLLGKLQRPGWTLCGLEPDLGCVERVKARMGIDVRQGLLEDRRFDPGFDVITLIHVLEHVADPVAGLAEVRRLLKPDGAFIVEVPVHDSYGFALSGNRWLGLDLPRHLTHFTSATLRRMVERAGFRTKDLHRKPTPAMDTAMISWGLMGNMALNALLYPAAWFLHKMFRGSVLRMVAVPR